MATMMATGPWKWTLLALLLVYATSVCQAEQQYSDCASDDEGCFIEKLERSKRSSDLHVEVNGDQTTAYYLKMDSLNRPRPLGLITSTEGAFVNDGTTTQYVTQIMGTSLSGTYAKIISTSQRVFSPYPINTDVPEYHPTGLVSSTVLTRISAGTTTLETTQVFRTYIGNLYAQEILTRSEIIKPTVATLSLATEIPIGEATIQSSIVTEIPSEQLTSGSVVFQKSYLTHLVGQRVIPSTSVSLEEDWEVENSDKLLDSFTEDNFLRARKADTNGAIIVDNIDASQPVVALPTFRAGRRLDDIFAEEDARNFAAASVTTTSTEKQPEVVVRTEQRIESHETKGDSVVIKLVHQDVPDPTPASMATVPSSTTPEDPSKPTTVTYEGFAAFTTQVGNTHIVFKPSLALSPSSALPRPVIESSSVATSLESSVATAPTSTEHVSPVQITSEAPVTVIKSQVTSSQSMSVSEEKEPIKTSQEATPKQGDAVSKPNSLMSDKPLEVMATALTESQESARKARVSVGDNPWVVFATNSAPVPEKETPEVATARQVGTDSTILVADDETLSESLIETSSQIPVATSAVPLETTQIPVIALATEQTEASLSPSAVKPQSVLVFSAVSVNEILLPAVDKEEAPITMSSEEPESETEASTEPNVDIPVVIMPSMIEPDEMPETTFTTYTYFTTFFDDRTTKVITREEVITNILKTTSSSDTMPPSTAIADLVPSSTGISSNGMMKTFLTTYTYFTTVLTDGETVVSSRIEVYSNVVSASRQAIEESIMSEFGLTSETESVSQEATLRPSTVRQLETSVWAGKVFEPHTESDESMNHQVAQLAPALLASNTPVVESSMMQEESVIKTLFTTFTYFTTFFNEGTSEVTSKEETVMNVVTEGGETTTPIATEAIFPVTYYTTYTYWTTSTNEGQLVVTSREETESRVVIPTETVDSMVTSIEEPAVPSSVVSTLTTFYTTFTYFTTSFDGENPIVSSSFETVTNVVNGISSVIEESTSAQTVGESSSSNAVHEPIGLLSSLTSLEVNEGVTTSFSTDVIGTFINGLYATILESTSKIAFDASPTVIIPQTTAKFPTGLVSVNIGTAFDIDDPTTTYFTSKAFGTYIGDLYAQVIESTTSLSVDEAKTAPTVTNEFRTGLVRSIEGSIVKDSLTTIYGSQIIGTFINELYAQIIQSTSTFIEATPTAVVVEASAAVSTFEASHADTTLPQPSTTPLNLEGSISTESTPNAEENDATPTVESKLLGGKLKFPGRLSPASRSRPAFSPSFRPVNTQRPRPGLPVKKSKSVSVSASIEASPASTSSAFVSRGVSSRFGGSSSKLSATASQNSNRLFRLTRPSSGFAASSVSPLGNSLTGRRASSSINPTPASAGTSSFRRSSVAGGFQSSRGRPSSAVPFASSRFSAGQGLTRQHQRPSSSAAQEIHPTPALEQDVTVVDKPVEERQPSTQEEHHESEEPIQESVASTRPPPRQPLRPITPRPQPATTTSARRQFPFRRPQLPTSAAPTSTQENENGLTGGPTTAKPRFVRPPKITVTARPRPTLSPLSRRILKRPGQALDNPLAEEDFDTQASSITLRRRFKRENRFYAREQRATERRRQIFEERSPRTRSASWEDPAGFGDLDYEASEEVAVTPRPRFPSSRQTTTSFRSRAPATTQTSVRRPSRPRLSPTGARQSEFTLTNRQPTSSSSRFRKPSSESSASRTSFRRPETSARQRTRVSSQPTTTEEPVRGSSGRRFNSNSRRPSSANRVRGSDDSTENQPSRQREQVDSAPALITPMTVTYRVASETSIPVVKNGVTEYRTVITAMPSYQVLQSYATSKISGVWRYLASELTSIKSPGLTEVTQYFIKPSETAVVEFTPTTIRGRHTSFSHIIPSTVYDIETSVTSIQDPVAATNNLLQQLLLGNLGNNPLLGVPATPVTQFTTHTSTYITTLTDAISTILSITLRGKEVRTTIVHSSTSVATLTEVSTETNIITPAQQLPFGQQANPFASLLPALLQNQLLQGQLGLLPTPASQPQPIQPTVAPHFDEEDDQDWKSTESPKKSVRQQQKVQEEEFEPEHEEVIKPAKPQPVTSVVTLYLSGRRPGEFSSVLSTVTLDGSEASVVKRHLPQTATPIEASALPFAIGTDKGLFELPDSYKSEDLEYYLVSAMNEVGAQEIYDTEETQYLQYVLNNAMATPELHGDFGKRIEAKSRKVRQALDSAEEESEFLSPLIDEDWAKIEPLSGPQVDNQAVEVPASVSTKVRKTKTVIVTRKVRPTAGVTDVTPSQVVLEESSPSNSRRRKVVVVTRRVKPNKLTNDPLVEPTLAFQEASANDLATDIPFQESFVPDSTVAATPVVDQTTSKDGRRIITVTRKRPVSTLETLEPDVSVTATTPAPVDPALLPKNSLQLDSSLGDVHAPRTYYTIYSYLYTALNTGAQHQVSSRIVTVSEIVRGKDGRLPSTFVRTENSNGLYTLTTSASLSNLGTRVSAGQTLQVNLASAVLVKYGRGAIRAGQPSEVKQSETNTLTSQRPVRVRPTPVEPSFTSPLDEETSVHSEATQKLPSRSRTTITRTISRSQVRSTASAAVSRQPEPSSTFAVRTPGTQRQRGTVRFGGALDSATGIAVAPVAASSRTFIRRPSSRTSPAPLSRFTPPTRVVTNSVEDDYQEPEFEGDAEQDDYQEYDEEVPFDGEEDGEGFEDDIPHYDEEYPEHDDDYPVDEDHHDEGSHDDDLSQGPSAATSSASVTTAPSTLGRQVSSTRSRINPLEKHLSSIRAAAKSSTGVVSSSLLPFRSRLAQRLSASSSISGSIQPSHVYYHTFATTSTLLVDGGRDPVLVTLMTSTLTTLADSELAMVTEFPQAFSPVTATSASPILRSSSRLSLFLTRTASSRNSPSSSSASTVVPTISSSSTILAPSTEALESSFASIDSPVDESTEPITTIMPSVEDMETTPFSLEEENVQKEAVTVFSTVVETELRTFTAVVTRKSNDEEIVTTHFETVPEVVTKTLTVVQIRDAPTARFVGSGGSPAQILDPSPSHGLRGARLSIDANARQPLATKVMSNGVEVIVAGERKNTLLAHEVVQGTQVLDALSPFTLPPTTISNAMLVDSEVQNQGLLSSIQSATAEFLTQTYLTTFTYLTTLLEGETTVVSSRHEIISNIVTRESGHVLTTPVPDLTLTSGFVDPSYSTYTYLTTYTYFNTFLDNNRPVILKSKETVSNVVTVPADSANKLVQSSTALFDTQTYLRTYTFSKTLSNSVRTTEEVITQVVITEAPVQAQGAFLQPTPAVSSELTKTYLTTVTYLTTALEGTDTVIRHDTVVSSEIVTETIFSEVEATPTLPLPVITALPNLEASLPLSPFDEESDGPIFATKTFFTTSTYYTTLLEDESTVTKSRTEVTSSIATEMLPQGLGALFKSTPASATIEDDSRTTYLSLGSNLYGQLRTVLATATYYITDAQGSVATKQLVVPQVMTQTVSTTALPSDAVVESSSSILSPGSLASLKSAFLASSSASASILGADQLQSLKSSFVLSSTPSVGPEEATNVDVSIPDEPNLGSEGTLPDEPNLGATPPLVTPFPPPQVGTAIVTSPTVVTGLDGSVSSVSSGATVVMVTDAAGGVAVLPTEVLTSGTTIISTNNNKPSLWNLGTLGTVGLAALSQGLSGGNLGGLNINLGPVIDSMTGLISNAFLSRRNDSIARTQSHIPSQVPIQQEDPVFIPIGSLGATQNDREDGTPRRPTFIPLRRPQLAPQQPAPGVPLQPQPGSPLFRPGSDPRPLVQFPGQSASRGSFAPQERPGFHSPLIETGFSAIQPTSRASVITGAETIFVGRLNFPQHHPNAGNFERNQQGPGIHPSRPVIFQGATTQFFDPNGQPFPDRSPVRFPNPIAPPNQPVMGNLVPGPEGKPVRIVAVPEGIAPPPGASGQVFVRPAVQPGSESAPVQQQQQRPVQQTPALPPVRPGSAPIMPLPMVEFDAPRPVASIQTIVSIEGDNKIVGTRIVSHGQTVLIQPTRLTPRPIEALPTTKLEPTPVSAFVHETVSSAIQTPEVTSEVVELQVSSEASPVLAALPEEPEVVANSVAQAVAPSSAASTTPLLLPSFASEITVSSSASQPGVLPGVSSWTTPIQTATRVNEPDGITKVILGPDSQLTTFVTRVETSADHSHTLISTIVDGHTQVNAVQPTATPSLQQSDETTVAEIAAGSPAAAEPGLAHFTQEFTTSKPVTEKQSVATTTMTTTSPPIRLGGIGVFPFATNGPSSRSTTTTTEESIADKVLDESVNNVLLSGPQRTQVSVSQPASNALAKCSPQCRDFEICQQRGFASPMCICRPGYARSDATQPCTKAFTYQVRLALEDMKKQPSMSNFTWTTDVLAPEYKKLAQVLRTGIQETLSRADLWDAYRSVDLMTLHPAEHSGDKKAMADFVVQLGSQYDETQLKNSLEKALENNQYRLGDDLVTAARISDGLQVQDFDECHAGVHDCPESSTCVNNHGSYECRCKPGTQDAIDGSGRLCVAASQELGDCDSCNRQGRCDSNESGENICICNYWFAGDRCQYNLKVLMIVLVALGVLLILLTLGCIIVCCIRNRRASSTISPAAPAFLRYRGGVPPTGTMDRTAMIRGDTSSESSIGMGISGIDNMAGTLEGRGKGNAGASLQSYRHYGEDKDKVPVIIPRVRTHRDQPPVHGEQQMLSYLEQGRAGPARSRSSSRDNLASVAGRSSTFTTLRGPESSDAPNHTSTPATHATNGNTGQVELTMNEARSYDETTVRPAMRHLPSSMGSTQRTSHGGKHYFQHEQDARPSGARAQGRPPLRLAFPRPNLYTSFRDSEGSNFDSL